MQNKLETWRTQKMSKNRWILVKCVLVVCEGCRFESHSWRRRVNLLFFGRNLFCFCVGGRGFESRKEARFFLTGFRSHVSLGKQKHWIPFYKNWDRKIISCLKKNYNFKKQTLKSFWWWFERENKNKKTSTNFREKNTQTHTRRIKLIQQGKQKTFFL